MSDRTGTVVIDRLRFTEGPAFDESGSLYFSEIPRGRIYRVDPDGRAQTFVEGGAPNGLAFHPRGEIYYCDGDSGVVGVADERGHTRVFVPAPGQRHFDRPNDCAFDDEGNLYFTDPGHSSMGSPTGVVYRASPHGEVMPIITGMVSPNGVALAADCSALFIAETLTRRIHRFALSRDGTIEERRVYCQLPDDGLGPDGIDFDADGNLYVAHYGAGRVEVVAPDGGLLDPLITPGERASNVEFLENQLYVTVTSGSGDRENGKVVRYELDVRGRKPFSRQAVSGPPTATL
jgi:gluconolactonase